MKIPLKAPPGGARNDIVSGDRVAPNSRGRLNYHDHRVHAASSCVCKAYTARADGGLDKSAIANVTGRCRLKLHIVRNADEKAVLLEGVANSDNKVIVPAPVAR